MPSDFLTDTYMILRKRFRSRALRILGNPDEAEDALQEAFYKLWSKQYAIRSASDAEALLTTAVRNSSLDAVRRRKRKVPVEEADRIASDDQRERREQYAVVESLVRQRLNPTQQLILKRMEEEDVTLDQIARELDMQPAAVRMQLSRARKTIRELYLRMET